jgi:hypothetical protein
MLGWFARLVLAEATPYIYNSSTLSVHGCMYPCLDPCISVDACPAAPTAALQTSTSSGATFNLTHV